MKNRTFTHAIALTGGIATGKSTVCSLLRLHGFLTIDADKIAHKLLDEHHKVIASMFGEHYVQEGKVLRKELGKIIFSNEEAKLKLEAFIHPLIKEEIEKEAAIFEAQAKPYFIDIPLFFEKMHYPIERSVVIYTPKSLQIERLMKRDNISEEEALLKISNQMDIEKKKELATFIIDNSSSLKNLQNEVENLKEKLL
ncbi:MAG: dephospho-CoA kinase [Arcobacteraceae bacterium]